MRWLFNPFNDFGGSVDQQLYAAKNNGHNRIERLEMVPRHSG